MKRKLLPPGLYMSEKGTPFRVVSAKLVEAYLNGKWVVVDALDWRWELKGDFSRTTKISESK